MDIHTCYAVDTHMEFWYWPSYWLDMGKPVARSKLGSTITQDSA